MFDVRRHVIEPATEVRRSKWSGVESGGFPTNEASLAASSCRGAIVPRPEQSRAPAAPRRWRNIRNSCWPLTTRQPDVTLDEVVAAMCKQRVAGGGSAVCRFRSHQLQKEGRGRRTKSAGSWVAPTVGRDGSRVCNPARLVVIGETCASTNMVRLRGRCPRGVRRPCAPWAVESVIVATFAVDGSNERCSSPSVALSCSNQSNAVTSSSWTICGSTRSPACGR